MKCAMHTNFNSYASKPNAADDLLLSDTTDPKEGFLGAFFF